MRISSLCLPVVLAGSLASAHSGLDRSFYNFCKGCAATDGYGKHVCRMSSAALCYRDETLLPFCDVCELPPGVRETKAEYQACVTAAQAQYKQPCDERAEDKKFEGFCSVCQRNDDYGVRLCRYESRQLCDADDTLSFCGDCKRVSGGVKDPAARFQACITAARNYYKASNKCDDTITDTYSWQFSSSPSSDCSVTCGSGTYSVVVKCVNDVTEEEVSDSNCDAASKPPTSYECNRPPCTPADGGDFSVVATPWSECSKSCSEGMSQRRVECFDNDSGLVVGARKCGRELYKQPLQQECNKNVDCAGDYFLGYTPWSRCSQGCVDNDMVGVSERKVKCFYKEAGGNRRRRPEEKPMEECKNNGHVLGPLLMPCNTNKVCDVRSTNGDLGVYSNTINDELKEGEEDVVGGGGGKNEDDEVSVGVVGGVCAGMAALVTLAAVTGRRGRNRKRREGGGGLLKGDGKKTSSSG